jgi:hypothetical protein
LLKARAPDRSEAPDERRGTSALRQGVSDYEAMVEAAYQATDLLDFSRHGSRTDAVRRYVPFINAHFQGLDKAYRTMVQPLLDKARGDQVLSTDAPHSAMRCCHGQRRLALAACSARAGRP